MRATLNPRSRRYIIGVCLLLSISPPSRAQFETVGLQLSELAKVETTGSFRLPEPETTSVRATIDGKAVELAAFWPNAAATSTIDFSGEWVGVGNGAWKDFDGKQVAGRVAVMRIESGWNWLRAFELGAKAVLFVPRDSFGRVDAESKFSQVPIHAPRFLLADHRLTAHHKSKLLSGSGSIDIHCRQKWVVRNGHWLLARIPGTDPERNGAVLFVAHNYSPSVTPGFADERVSDSAQILTELARAARAARPKMDVYFAFVNGHQNALQGERELVDWLLVKRKLLAAVVTFDLSGGSKRLGLFSSGKLYETRPESRDGSRGLALALRQYADELSPKLGITGGSQRLIDGVNESDGKPWKSMVGTDLALGCEPFVLAGYPAVTFATIDDARLQADVPRPFQIPNANAAENLRVQREFLKSLLMHALNRAGANEGAFRKSMPVVPVTPSRTSLVAGQSTLLGRAAQYDPTKSFLPDVGVADAWVRIRGIHKTLAGVRGDFVTLSGDDGSFSFAGIDPVSAHWHSIRAPKQIDAFRTDPSTGIPNMAATLSATSGVPFDRSFFLTLARKETPVVLFPADPGSIFGLLESNGSEPLTVAKLVDAKNFSEPRDFDIQSSWLSGEGGVGVAFARPKGNWNAVLNSATGAFAAIQSLAPEPRLAQIERLRNLVDRNKVRLDELAPFRMVDRELFDLHSRSIENLELAESAAQTTRWSEAITISSGALADARRVHQLASSFAPSSTTGLLMYLGLLVPFAIVLERIAFGRRKFVERISVAAVIFLVGYFSLRALHPAFLVVRNSFVVYVGFVLLSLSLFVGVYVAQRFDVAMQSDAPESKNRKSGGSVAFEMALIALRKRPLRTFLTSLVVAAMTFAGMAFTSLAPVWSIRFDSAAETRISENFVRATGFGPITIDKAAIGDPNAKRVAWRFAAADSDGGSIALYADDKFADVRALVGVEEMGDGEIRLPKAMVEALGLPIGGKVAMLGRAWKLEVWKDGLAGPPIDFGATPPAVLDDRNGETKPPARIDPSQIAIVSVDDALALGGTVREIHFDPAVVNAQDLTAATDLLVYASTAGQTERVRPILAPRTAGWLAAGMAMLLGAYFVFQSLLASAIERKVEISLLSALGMPPAGIGRVFRSEALILGLMGVVLGYFLAQAFARIAVSSGQVSHLTFQFGGQSSIVVTMFVLGACWLSALYPARVALGLAARSSLSDQSRPEGETWRISAPLTVAASDSDDFLRRLYDWLEEHRGAASSAFIVEDLRLTDGELACLVSLAPFELSISQRAQFSIRNLEIKGIVAIDVELERVTGDAQSWERANRVWIDELRFAMLDWRSRSPEVSSGELIGV